MGSVTATPALFTRCCDRHNVEAHLSTAQPHLQDFEQLVVQTLDKRDQIAPHFRLAGGWIWLGVALVRHVGRLVQHDVRVGLQQAQDLQQV